MNYKIAKVFSSGTEYEIFRSNYCEDFQSFHNYIDTHVWCEKHKDI